MRLASLLTIVAMVWVSVFSVAAEATRFPGQTEQGFLLPNGWTVSPAGQQVILPDLPLNIVALSDNRHVLVATSGYNSHDLTLIDLEKPAKLSTETVRQSWFGLAITPGEDKLWWSGGGGNMLHTFELKNGKLARTGSAEEPAKERDGNRDPKDQHFKSGLLIDAKRNVLYSLDIDAGTLSAIDLGGKQPERTLKLGGRPYDVALARNGSRLYVSDWAGRVVLAIDPGDLRVVAKIAVGEHPNQIALHPQDDRLFVACASSNHVAVIDTRRGIVTETISTALFPKAPEGSTPDALAVAPDGKKLYVANADNNCVAVVDIAQANHSQVQGFIPTGWYPTAVAVTPDGTRLLIGVGKGNQTRANPRSAPGEAAAKTEDPKSDRPRRGYPYIGTTLSGALSIVPIPEVGKLSAYTEVVYRNCPYSDTLLSDAPHPTKTAIPTKVGDPSPIKYVIYIIKENRTYDQVFGDIGRGNCDPSLVMFGQEVTPNHHKLANEFVLLDNLYCNGHVSADGHPWSTMAYNTDYTARNWALTYSSREGIEDDDEGDLQKAPSGYLWDACARHDLTYRSYGEYGGRVSQPDGSIKMEGRVPGLVGHMPPTFGIPKVAGQRSRDTDNVDSFLTEFHEFERNDNLPKFIIMSLGEDHTTGTRPGTFTPQACVASNDLALGRMVEAISRSKYWPQIAIFVIEDDAQNGPDHVDAHRTVGLVISPYVKRKALDSTQYTTVSMIRTLELILGLEPLSQFDAAAQPMFATFTDKADVAPYTAESARIDVNLKNDNLAYGAKRSSRMDFSEYDKIDDFELNEILWRAIKGPHAPLPPSVRRAIAYRVNSR
ncbi:MAG: bifunctional YncE family protein/alkaline phosphatase family protein [Planctomycetia bacterium]|nr:bifunctional YncE family protein/alkaline phosphatase family protein [Planctomycetia bacterium]